MKLEKLQQYRVEKIFLRRTSNFFSYFLLFCILSCLHFISDLSANEELLQFEAIQFAASPFAPASRVLFANKNTFYINVSEDKNIIFKINLQKPPAGGEAIVKLQEPRGNEIRSEKLSGQSLTFTVAERVDVEGTYRLTVDGNRVFYTVDIENPHKITGCPPNFFGEAEGFFYVPEGVKGFEVFLQGTGSRQQCASIDIGYGDKIVANATLKEGPNEKLSLKLDNTESGIWRFNIKNVEGKASGRRLLSFSKNIPPYVSFSANSLMRVKQYGEAEIRLRYQDIFANLRKEIGSLPTGSGLQNDWKESLTQILEQSIRDAYENKLSSEQKKTKDNLLFLNDLLGAYKDGALNFDKCVVYTVKAITNRRVLPDDVNVRGKISNELLMLATPGEYEPVSFVIKPLQPIESLHFNIGDLTAPGGLLIPASSIDLKSVKCWYQDLGDWREKTPAQTWGPQMLTGKKELVPELLLNDDSLILVDTEQKHNYAMLDFADGSQKKICISDGKNGILPYDCEEFPIKDSDVLLPLNLPGGKNKQFWLTVQVPENARPGTYESEIQVYSRNRRLGSLSLKVKVLPFKLDQPRFLSSMFHSQIAERFYKTEERILEQYSKELDNQIKHGVTNSMCPYEINNIAALDIKISKLKSLGIDTIFIRGPVKWLFYYSNTKRKPGDPIPKELFEEFTVKVEKILNVLKEKGINTVYFYGFDERWGTALLEQRPAWEIIRKLGGKIYVTGAPNDVNRPPGNFQGMGDIQDMFIAGGYPQAGEAAKWHSKGHKIVSYANPGLSAELPETYRINYGLLLWQYDYDGALSYLYHFGRGVGRWIENGVEKRGLNFPATYDDFSPVEGRKKFNVVYPTIDGVIDTVQWEGYREGVDDLRYLATLLNIIDKYQEKNDKKMAKVIAQAKAYLQDLKAIDINLTNRDMDTIRLEIIQHILAIMQEVKK